MKMSGRIYLGQGACSVLLCITVVTCVNLEKGLPTDICSCKEADESNNIKISNIPESLPKGSLIKKLDIGGGDNIILLSKLPPNISFDNTTQEFRVREQFNITQSTPLLLDSITVTCIFDATRQEVIFKVFMEIYDQNNNAPIFTNLPFIFNLSEAIPQGSTILPEITAIDADPSDAGKLTYSIKKTDEYSDYFNFMVASSGKLTLIKELNYDLVKHINLSVQVKDNSYGETILGVSVQNVVQTTVLINIVPVLGESLLAIKTSYSLTISDNDRVVVIDPSFNNSTDLVFILMNDTSNDDYKSFKMTSKNLEIVSDLTKTEYTLVLKVKKSLKNVFVISIIFINVLKPTKFLSPVTNIVLVENTLIGTLVAIMETRNPKKETTFYFIDKSQEVEFFQLDRTSGCITTRTDLQTIKLKEFNLTVGLKDSSTSTSDTARLRIRISTVVNSSPKFNQTLYEFQPMNFSWIGQVQAFSASSAIPVSYRLLDSYRKFSINRLGSISCFDCTTLKDATIAIVVIAEAETPYNRSDSALVLVHLQQEMFQQNWMIAFIISIVLALLLLIALLTLVFITFKGVGSQRNLKSESPDHISHANPRKKPALKTFQKNFFNPKSRKLNVDKHSPSEVRSVSSDVQQIETSSVRTLVIDGSNICDSSTDGCEIYLNRNASTCRKSDRIDWTSSQDTINASNMTLTRPAVGTNGITLYY